MTKRRRNFLPNFFLLGAAKCGTTTLHAYLDKMPDICMSRPKEPFFFEAEFERGIEFYRKKYFAHWKDEPVIGDARHRNLYLPYIPQRIHQINPDAKLVAILRNPIDRAFSHWRHRCYHNVETLSFEKAIYEDLSRLRNGFVYNTAEEIKYHSKCMTETASKDAPPYYRTFLDSGYYYDQIRRYLECFPRENLKVILLEDLAAQPEATINGVIEHLELDPVRNRFTQMIHENPARKQVNKRSLKYKAWKFTKSLNKRDMLTDNIWQFLKLKLEPSLKREDRPGMDAHMRSWLRDHYQEHNLKLSEFLNRDLSHWV